MSTTNGKTTTDATVSFDTESGIKKTETYDWHEITKSLDTRGNAHLPGFLSPAVCQSIIQLYSNEDMFRKRVVMAQHGFGRGEYKYFNYPLPDLVQELRTRLYKKIAPIANRWNVELGLSARFPDNHEDFLQKCKEAGQNRPTPLILKYEAGDYNCLHQDLYGENVFPIQVAFLLSRPVDDFSGGEFVLTEQRPRMQSRVEVVPLMQGDAVAFTVNKRPVQGTRGTYGVNMRHGVSTIRTGDRLTMGIIFHDAQ